MRRASTRLAVGIAAVVGCARFQGGVPSATVSRPAAPRTPELYGAGLFSTGAWDFFVAWSPDSRHVLFCRADTTFSTYEILETRRDRRGRRGGAAPVYAVTPLAELYERKYDRISFLERNATLVDHY